MRDVFTEVIFQVIECHLMYEVGFDIICKTSMLKCNNKKILNDLKRKYPRRIAFTIRDETLTPDYYGWIEEKDSEKLVLRLRFGKELVEFYFSGYEIQNVLALDGTPLVSRPTYEQEVENDIFGNIFDNIIQEEIDDYEDEDIFEKTNEIDEELKKKREEFLQNLKTKLGNTPIQNLINMNDKEREELSEAFKNTIRK